MRIPLLVPLLVPLRIPQLPEREQRQHPLCQGKGAALCVCVKRRTLNLTGVSRLVCAAWLSTKEQGPRPEARCKVQTLLERVRRHGALEQ